MYICLPSCLNGSEYELSSCFYRQMLFGILQSYIGTDALQYGFGCDLAEATDVKMIFHSEGIDNFDCVFARAY